MTGASVIFPQIPRNILPYGKKISQTTYVPSKLDYVYNLDLTDPIISQIRRGGVIFYTFKNGNLFFCLGRDRRSKEITDFGGGKKERFENILECAVREGNEESRQALGTLTMDNIKPHQCLYGPQMLIIFIQVTTHNEKLDIFKLTNQNFKNYSYVPAQYFNQGTEQSQLIDCYNENSGLVWLSQPEMEQLLSNSPQDRFFPLVRKFIISNPYMKLRGEEFKKIFDKRCSQPQKDIQRTYSVS